MLGTEIPKSAELSPLTERVNYETLRAKRKEELTSDKDRLRERKKKR